MCCSRIGRGSSMSAPSTPRPSGRWPIAATVSVGMPTWMNSSRPPLGGDHPERAVLGVDQLDGRVDDALEHHRQLDGLDDGLRRPEQGAKAPLRVHDLARALHELLERPVEFRPRMIGEGQR